ncbi:hypothetical protein ATR1_175c0001, partial [Acetobacter tropicalis]
IQRPFWHIAMPCGEDGNHPICGVLRPGEKTANKSIRADGAT